MPQTSAATKNETFAAGETVVFDDPRAEAARQMTICNACRYCEGLCAVFPVMHLRNAFTEGDVNYLANLCHNCGACYHDCQFSPPHEFAVNIPRTLAQVRADTYRHYAWPAAFGKAFRSNGALVTTVTTLATTAFFIGAFLLQDPSVIFAAHTGPGAFYQVMPHNAMVWLFGPVFLFSLFAMFMGFLRFWREAGDGSAAAQDPRSMWQAFKDACSLRYLDGGGPGCMNEDDKPTDRRKIYHHFTFYGFLLCFAATSVGTIYHYGFGWIAPYGYFSLPVILGTLGGLGLVIGPLGLIYEKRKRDARAHDDSQIGMEQSFLWLLFLVSVTGLVLLAFRETAAMGVLLMLHLGVVMGFFLIMPYSKFVHFVYRIAALMLFAWEKRRGVPAKTEGARVSSVG